ncbi:MAG: hypothetical protein A3H92_00370 [Rhodospirillales bacterium RIFCSPLOWO2_02_FULL_58_16]|nr:MAG: hypothetical protein A3H92_00370 [Rhodospirillales bacterium RIFCSPLOWO2_02_FULL_58_16]
MACGVPLVSARVGMAEDVISDGVNGALVDVGDVDAIVGRGAALLSDSALASSWRTAGRAVAERHDWSKVALQLYEKVYKELL